MLTNISIKNLGLVENENIDFFDGFTVITGETGSGKSFFCNAIRLGMGERAKNMKIGKSERTVIELSLQGKIFRRVLDQNKSRFFIDDIPENLKSGQDIASKHFHMHSQHDNIFLKQPEAATEIFDRSLQNTNIKSEYIDIYSKYSSINLELKKVMENLEKKLLQKEFWEFQLDKMSKINFSLEELEHAENIIKSSSISINTKDLVEESIQILAGEGESILSLLDIVENNVKKLKNEKISEKITKIFAKFPEIISDIEALLPNNDNEQEMQEAQELVSNVSRWSKEFGVISPEQLFEKKQNLEQDLEEISNLEYKTNLLEYNKTKLLEKLEEKAEELSLLRKENYKNFGKIIEEKCCKMGMEKAQFKVNLKPISICKYGKEQVEFLFSANQNELQNLSSSASGGEIARITLALKQFFPENTTMIFDEIDTGVSGRIAEKMASEMKALSKNRQIISITHLPQIAAMAKNHLVVEKKHLDKKTVTNLRYVTGNERVNIIAKMISGENVSDEALIAAQKLLK
jgi:DNA repair protein RecN (Recombination protein N)